MQTGFHPPEYSQIQIPWKNQKTPHNPLHLQSKQIPRNPKIKKLGCISPPKVLISSNSEFNPTDRVLPTTVKLPVIIRKAGRVSRYVWDGTRFQLVASEQESSNSFGIVDGFTRIFRVSSEAIRNLFVPRQVQRNYMGYLKWKLLHRVFSSSLQVLATQAMFRAIGFGSLRALPSAAAMNWVLKDGLGRLSRCIYTASLGSAFDTNLKIVRFSSSVLFSLSIGVELLTPTFPQHFLLLGTIANIAKSISLAAYLATGSAIHRSFAIADNLGEVSAKAQIQTVCFDNVGLMLAAMLNLLCKNKPRFQAGLPLLVYPIFATIELYAIYQGLKHVHLQTLTKDRLEIIIDTWIQHRFVPSPAEVTKEEGIFVWKKGSQVWPIRIGCADPKGLSPRFSVLAMQCLTSEDFYFICMETSHRGLSRKQHEGILLSLCERAVTKDIIMGLLQACHIRESLLDRSRDVGVRDVSNTAGLAVREWLNMVADCKIYAQREVNHLIQELQKCGWAAKNVLLNTREQIRYTLSDNGRGDG